MSKLPDISIETIKNWISNLDRKTLIQYGMVAGAFLGFVLFFLLPVLLHNKKMTTKSRLLERKISIASAKIARIPQMKKQKELYGERLKRIREQFFESKETDRLIEIVSTTAATAGVKISASRPSSKPLELPVPFDQIYTPVNYELIVEGSYHNIGVFMNSLEAFPKHFTVLSFEIVSSEKSQEIHRCTLFLTAFLKRG